MDLFLRLTGLEPKTPPVLRPTKSRHDQPISGVCALQRSLWWLILRPHVESSRSISAPSDGQAPRLPISRIQIPSEQVPFANLPSLSHMLTRLALALGILGLAAVAPQTSAATIVDDSTCVWQTSSLSCLPSAYCSYQFKTGDVTPSQSCRVTKGSNKIPQQFRLAYAGATAGTGMTISWSTFTDVSDNTVWTGSSSSALTASTATVTTSSYYAEDQYTQFQHHATVSGLSPHTKYYYKVGSKANSSLQSDVYSFTTARSASDSSTFKIAVYGDAGDGDNSADTISYVNTLGSTIDFVWHIGDISYADDDYLTASQALGFFYEEVYNKWMNSLTSIMTVVPYMVLVGNHEAECHSPSCQLSSFKKDSLGNYTAFNARFKMPSSESGGTLNMWHSFNHGPIHFTSISSETDYTNFPTNQATLTNKNGYFGDQLTWLEADLQKANASRSSVPWLIVGMHRPIYSVADADSTGNPTGQALYIQEAFEALFIKYDVDVVVAGHKHSYERTLPIASGKAVTTGVSSDNSTYTNVKAPVYIITGAAGNVENHDSSTSTAAWNVITDYTHYGISMLTASKTSLAWEFLNSADQTVLDKFTIVKS